LHVYVELVTGEPRSGYDVEFRVTMTDGDGTGRLSQISWGDGTAVRFGYPAIACPSPPASSPPRRDEPSTKVETIRHGYRHAGSRRVTVEVNSPSDCRPDRDAELVSGTTTVDVAVGVQRSNGPHDATVDAYREPAPDDRARFVGIAAAGRDDDGYPRSLTVDWGDGSASRPVTNDADCDDGSGAHYPYDRNGPSAFSGDFSHTYAKPGTYAVRVLFFSTGCDGSDQQAGTAALRVSV
jgi:hypothetical protein